MKSTEYTVERMRSLLENMSGMYDLARVVDPIEGRILEFHSDGRITRNERCYGIWDAGQKCVNCSSVLACQTGLHQEKREHFQDQVFHIQSNPVTLKLPDGGICKAVVELVSIEKGKRRAPGEINDRAAENADHAAAEFQSLHDSLTKVLNALAFYERSREMLLKFPERRWVMVTGNIMEFHLINTLFSVEKGNEILVKTAVKLQQMAAQAGGLCGRLSGDRFALLLPRESFREDALRITAQTLADTFSSGIYTFCFHFGVYGIDDASISVSVMCDRANTALRTIRADLTRTVAWFDDAMLQKSLFEQEVISGFEDALKNGQFRMYLQPLAAADGNVYGGEALVRWLRPDGQMVMPDSFIETLEHAGLIHELDMYMWELAVKQLNLWEGTDKEELTISVNLSAKDFYSIDVYRVLTELVDKYGVDSRKLRLEITETALLDEPEKTDEVVSRLQEKGFLVEIDDFGKGHSSLSLLKDIRADVLKIDMSLLREIEKKQRSRIILESVISMANSLGMEVTTEGVETEQQLRSLTAMGCEHFQGFYFSQPIPVEEFEMRYAPGKRV